MYPNKAPGIHVNCYKIFETSNTLCTRAAGRTKKNLVFAMLLIDTTQQQQAATELNQQNNFLLRWFLIAFATQKQANDFN